ncbi:hypothetical protein Tco_1347022 [Tanacetum coccineum]
MWFYERAIGLRAWAIEVNPGSEDFNTGNEDFNTGSLGVSTGSGPVSTPSVVQTINVTIPSPIKSQREGKAPMTTEEIQATKRTKAQIQQEEAGLAEAMRLQALQEEEAARQVHLDALLAKRISEEEELSEQQKKRKAEVQEAAQYYTEEDWDTIRAKLEANAELTKSLQGESMTSEDFAKRMVEMINQKKKFYAEQKAKARRSKPMTQAQQRDYMSTFIKNQSSWKLTQLKKLTFDELKTEFEKLVKSIENFVPMETDERVKRQGVQLEQEFSKKQKTIEEVSVLEESITEPVIAKEEEIEKSVKKRGKIRKQKARKGIHIDKTAQDESEEEREAFMKDKVTSASSESEIGIDAIPTATKPPSIVDWKIIPQSGLKAVYQIIRRDGSDKIYMSFGAILKDFSRDDLTELYKLVIKKYRANRPEEMYDRVLWGDLKTMFDPPLSDDATWSLPLQQKMINWRYYPSCAVHCLTLDASTIYMLVDRKYHLSKDACQVMLKMKLLDGTTNEVSGSCIGVEKDCLSVGLATTQQMVISLPCLTDIKNWLCCTKALATPEQTTTGKEISNPLTADSLLKTIREDEMSLKIKSKSSEDFWITSLEDGERMWNSIQNRPYQRLMIPNPDNIQQQILEPLSKMTEGNKKQYIADARVMNYLLQAIPNDIYNSVDACKNAKEMWERIKWLMFGSEVTSHVRHSRLMDEFDKFAVKEGESLESVYERLTTLVNIMNRNNVRPISVSINTKFLNCLQPEWSKYVTMVCHNQTGDAVSYDVLYDSLIQFEPHVLASKAKKAAKNDDPLTLISHSNASSS